MKTFDKLVIILANIFLLIVAIWAMTVPLTSSKKFYLYEFEKNNTITVTGYAQEELDSITDTIVDYLMDKKSSMQIVIDDLPVFSNQAINHMADVKNIYVKGKIIAIVCLFLLVLSIVYIVFRYKLLKTILFKYSLVTISVILAVCLVFGVYAFLNFDKAFTFFHHVIFPNEQKFNDAFFSYTSNYPELPGVNNLMLVKILDVKLFMDAGIAIGGFVVFIETLWFAFLLVLKRKIPN
ncbi:MAG TPA: DUF1461 domain-containing protein [Bacilli bacterium]|nr:DUF1461 domain-containing protein [Bacilli bacterium]